METQSKFKKMTETPVQKLVCQLAIPTIMSMLVTSFYNMADTYFVGKINTSATAAVGVVFSIMAIIQATGFFFGHGSGNFMSRKMGAQRMQEAEEMATTGFLFSLMGGCLITLVGLLFLNQLAILLGSTATILPYTRDYLSIILLGAPFMTGSLTLNNQLRLQGSAAFAMVGIVSGAVLNIVLDPILIFSMNMGIKGAATATVISQIVGFSLLFLGTQRKENISINIKNFRPSMHYFNQIINGGLPSLCRQGIASVATICLNFAAGGYGDAAIAAISIVNRIMQFIASIVTGFGQGFQPVCAFNYGAKLYDRVQEAFWFCVKMTTGFLVVAAVLSFINAETLVTVFQKSDAEVIAIGSKAMRFQCMVLPLIGFITLCNMMMQAIGRVKEASVLALSRQGLFFIPAILMLPLLMGLTGVQCAQAFSDLASFILACPLLKRAMNTMNQMKAQVQQEVTEKLTEAAHAQG